MPNEIRNAPLELKVERETRHQPLPEQLESADVKNNCTKKSLSLIRERIYFTSKGNSTSLIFDFPIGISERD